MTLVPRSLIALAAVLAAGLPVRAQDLRAAGTLQRVFVLPATGHGKLEGRLLDLGHDSLALLVKGQRIEVPLKDVVRIQTPGDSVKNGALIGALVGGLWSAWLCRETDSRFCTAAVGIDAAFGAAIGAASGPRRGDARRDPLAIPVLSPVLEVEARLARFTLDGEECGCCRCRPIR